MSLLGALRPRRADGRRARSSTPAASAELLRAPAAVPRDGRPAARTVPSPHCRASTRSPPDAGREARAAWREPTRDLKRRRARRSRRSITSRGGRARHRSLTAPPPAPFHMKRALLLTDIVDSTRRRAARRRARRELGPSTIAARAPCSPLRRPRDRPQRRLFPAVRRRRSTPRASRSLPRGARALGLSARVGLHVGAVTCARTPPTTSRAAPSRSRSKGWPSRWPRASWRWRAAARRC